MRPVAHVAQNQLGALNSIGGPSCDAEMVVPSNLGQITEETCKLLDGAHARLDPILNALGRGQDSDNQKNPAPAQNIPELARYNLHSLYLLQEKLQAIGAALGA